MNNFSPERLCQVLLAPHVSEKSSRLTDKLNQVVFKVVPGATKPEIKSAVEFLFKVAVNQVRVVSMPAKRKRFGKISGCRKAWKKAYVSLKAGQELNFVSGE